MSTRSLTAVRSPYGEELAVIYRQYDGYPSGHGAQLCRFLLGLETGLEVEYVLPKLIAWLSSKDEEISMLKPYTRRRGEQFVYTIQCRLGRSPSVKIWQNLPGQLSLLGNGTPGTLLRKIRATK